jgi:hypothetical protein
MKYPFYATILLLHFVMVCWIPSGVHAQSAVHTSWGTGTGIGGNMTFSVGQIFIQNITVPGVAQITEGVQHPLEVLTIGMDDESQTLEGIHLYPNPTAGVLNLQIKGVYSNLFTFKVFNNLGQCIQEGDVQNEISLLSLESLAAGSYRVQVMSTLGKQIIFQVIKRD